MVMQEGTHGDRAKQGIQCKAQDKSEGTGLDSGVWSNRRAEEGEEREMASFRMGFRCRLGTDGVVDFLILRSGTWSHQMLDWKVVGLFRLG